MKKIVLLLTLIIVGCSSDDNQNYKNVNFSLIGQSQLYGNGVENIEKSNFVIEDTTSWNDLINKMNSVNIVSANFKEINIDFSQYQVIAVFDKIYGNSGHSIDILKIIENETGIIIVVNNLMTGDDTQVMTQPFHIVKIPKTERQINFE